jgi:hypothetical protein
MSMLREYLTNEVKNWEFIGHAAMMQRFVLRNGQEYTPTKRIGRKGAMKQCFANSYKAVHRHVRASHALDGWRYVEGYCIHREHPILAIHHAWVTTDGSNAMDPTLDAAEYFYFGVAFDRMTMITETARNRFYGILDTGLGLNVRLMFEMDPELRAIVQSVQPSDAFKKAQEMMTCEQRS